MAKSADAADLKSADPQGLWGFKSPSGHHQMRKLNGTQYRHGLLPEPLNHGGSKSQRMTR
jgi:hypothetical protein